MRKVKIEFSYISLRIFGIYFYRNIYRVVLYVSYGFCPKCLNLIVARAKIVHSIRTIVKKNCLRNRKIDAIDTVHTCL